MVEITELTGEISRLAEELRLEVYVIGGVIRDALRGAPGLGSDLDFTVIGDSFEIARRLAAETRGKLEIHRPFLAAKVIVPQGDGVIEADFVSARRERYARPGALPEVEPGTFHEDLARRDFTINTLALPFRVFASSVANWPPPSLGREVIDRHGGVEDLERKRIKVLHDGSFSDDPTRIFRALRYEGRIGGALDARTSQLVADAISARVLDALSPARIVNELLKVALEESRAGVLERLRETGVAPWTPLRAVEDWPALLGSLSEVPEHRIQAVDAGDHLMSSVYRFSDPDRREHVFREFGYGAKRLRKLALEAGKDSIDE